MKPLTAPYRPPSIEPGKAYAFGDAYRPMTQDELATYAVERGKALKEALSGLGTLDTSSPEALASAIKQVQGAYQQANQQVLQGMGVTPASSSGSGAAPAVTSSPGLATRAPGGTAGAVSPVGGGYAGGGRIGRIGGGRVGASFRMRGPSLRRGRTGSRGYRPRSFRGPSTRIGRSLRPKGRSLRPKSRSLRV